MFGLTPKRIFYAALIASIFFTVSQYAPPYISRFQFGDEVHQIVRYAGTSRKDTETVRREVVQKAAEYGIAIRPRDILITKRGPAFSLEFDYNWHIDLIVYEHDLNFTIAEDGEVFGP